MAVLAGPTCFPADLPPGCGSVGKRLERAGRRFSVDAEADGAVLAALPPAGDGKVAAQGAATDRTGAGLDNAAVLGEAGFALGLLRQLLGFGHACHGHVSLQG